MILALLDRLGFLLRDRETRAGRLTNSVLYVLNTVFIALYIVSTYPLPDPYPALVLAGELLLGVVFLGEYAVRVYSAEDRWDEVTNPYTIADLLAVLPVFLLPGPAEAGFLRGLHSIRIFRFLRLIVREHQVFGRRISETSVRRAEISATIFLIFFVASGFVYAVEAPVNEGIGTWGDAFYYTVIAVSTVGFGDIIPQTAAGRWVTITAVLVGFVVVPWQATRLRQVSEEPVTCPECGAGAAIEDNYCSQCGTDLSDVETESVPDETAP